MSIDGQLLEPTYALKVNGTNLTAEELGRVGEIVVEQSLHLPDMFVIRVRDVGSASDPFNMGVFNALDQDTFPIGAEVHIDLGRGAEPSTVMKGEVTALELSVTPETVPTLIIRGYARSHRLHRGRQSASFQNVSDSDIVSTIASQCGLQASAEATSTVHDYVFQHNQTNWEFLRERAALNGFELFVEDRTLHFRKPQKNQSMAAEQKLWENLLSLHVTVSTAYQTSSVIVRAWDPKTKQAIVGTASSGRIAPDTQMGKTGSQMASTSFGDSKVYVVNQPLASQSAADTLAQAIYDNLEGRFIQAEGQCLGDPAIRPGQTIEMKTLGERLSGKYYLSSVTHTVNGTEGYTTTFVVSGRQTNSLLELMDARRDELVLPSVVVGVVTDNTDPDGWGRAKVKFPWLVDNDQSWWARIAGPMAGGQYGLFFLPEVDDEVLVAFEQGDITRPYIIGSLWNGQQKPPKANADVIADSKVKERLIKSRSGHVISFDDTSGAEKISIVDKTGNNSIVFDTASNTITIQASADVAITAKGKASVTAQQDVTVTTQANATVSASQNVDVKASGNATVSATGNASVSATGNLDLKGGNVAVQATTGALSLKATGVLTIQGSLVNIN